jgi:hypothetical protein
MKSRLYIVVVLSFVALVWAAVAVAQDAQKAEDVPSVSDVRLLRKMKKYDDARKYIDVILADKSVPDAERRLAYNESVTIALLADGTSAARTAAKEALLAYPDLVADPPDYPAKVAEIYDDMRPNMFGLLYLTSEPLYCKVYLDKRELGVTPLEGVLIPAGKQMVTAKMDMYTDETFEVSVAAGDSVRREIRLREYRDVNRPRFGVDVSAGYWWVNRPGDAQQNLPAPYFVTDWEKRPSFGVGAFAWIPMRAKVAFQVGLRYSRVGERWVVDGGTSEPDTEVDYTYNYLAGPMVFRYYPSVNNRFNVCGGIELAYLVSASASAAGSDSSGDITDELNPFQMGLLVGFGFDVPVASDYLMLTLLYAHGFLGVNDSTESSTVEGYKPREFRFSVGWLF